MDDGTLILLVENNKADEKLAMIAFKQNNLLENVVVARNGAEALDYLLGNDKQDAQPIPDLVILDLKMPKLGGLEVLQSMRAHHRTRCIPVVILTSSAEPHDVRSTYECGANSFIRKPIDLSEFTRIVGEIKRYWLEVNHIAKGI